MNYRQKSKKYGKWAFVRYKGDIAVYAVCQNCRYGYPAYRQERDENGHWSLHCLPDLEKLHRYCPQCGLKMSPYNGTEVYKIDHAWWEEADAAEGEEDG